MIDRYALRAARLAAVALLAGVVLWAGGCSVTQPNQAANPRVVRQQIDADVNATLSRLYSTSSQARQLVGGASGVLVFPSLMGGSFVLGGEYGRGALRANGATLGYYRLGGFSLGFQAGVQSRALVLVFTNQQALREFQNSNGWSVGAGASVDLATMGADGRVDSAQLNKPVVAFVLTNLGLSGGVSLRGTRVWPL